MSLFSLRPMLPEHRADSSPTYRREIQYTQCKIVGNGSFGVVFQTKLSPSGEDAAIKRVLQDKRFKVSTVVILQLYATADRFRIASSRSCVLSDTQTSSL